jgi:hypothetical protein
MSNWFFDLIGSSNQRRELDSELRKILALDNVGRGDEIHGTVNVIYSEDDAKRASLIGSLEARGVAFSWQRKEGPKP